MRPYYRDIKHCGVENGSNCFCHILASNTRKKRNVVSERKAKVNRDLSQHYSFTKPFFHVLEIVGDVPNKG